MHNTHFKWKYYLHAQAPDWRLTSPMLFLHFKSFQVEDQILKKSTHEICEENQVL